MGLRRTVAVLAGGALVLGLGGCAIVDQFSGRAVEYNLQAEQAQDQDLLLNIVRASERRPLEFTGVQSVSGTASTNGSSSLTFPFGPPKPGSNSFGLSEGVSGGPTFSVAVLDTQDFFEGILAPIPLQTVDFYIKEGYPRPLLFDLFVGDIIITQKNSAATHRIDIPNAVETDGSLLRFQLAASYLLNLGLTTEPQAKPTSYGALLTGAEASQLDRLARAAAAGLDVKQVGWCDLSEDDREAAIARLGVVRGTIGDAAMTVAKACSGAAKKVTPADVSDIRQSPLVLYRVQKSAAGFQLCFEEREVPAAPEAQPGTAPPPPQSVRDAIAGTKVACGADAKAAGAPNTGTKQGKEASTQAVEPQRIAAQNQSSGFTGITLGGALGQYLNVIKAKVRDPMTAAEAESLATMDLAAAAAAESSVYNGIDFSQPVEIQLVPRSTEGVIYYLGEIVRRHVDPEFAENQLVAFPYGPASQPIPYTLCLGPTAKPPPPGGYNCEPLLRVDESAEAGAGALSVAYNERTFTVPGERDRAGTSFQVLDLVTQLIALNKSAKSLPATSVFTIISPP